jgi:septum formation protein
MMLHRPLILASASPRRRELLSKLGLTFEVRAADLTETQNPGESPEQYVGRLAQEKAQAIAAGCRAAVAVLGADTTVVLDGAVLNKPRDLADSERMLRLLRGREHVVYTGVALVLSPERSVHALTVSTRVRFRPFDDATLMAYVASREGMDKAGSYGIQELGAALVREVQGSYSNVVGLPAAETIELLQRAAVLASWP